MTMHRKNKCQRRGGAIGTEPWFDANVARQRRRSKAAKKARRLNRGRI